MIQVQRLKSTLSEDAAEQALNPYCSFITRENRHIFSVSTALTFVLIPAIP
jgi:hypothetical protein